MPTSLDKITILIAEDQPTVADELRQLFEREGAKVLSAADIEMALIALEKAKPACAILGAGVAYETAMRLTKKLNTLRVPYIIQSDEAGPASTEGQPHVRHITAADRDKLIETVRVMIAK